MKRILVVGDSWGAGHVAEDQTDNGWPVMLGVPPELRQAIDGTTAAQWASDTNGMLSRALNTECDCVVVSLGGNDVMYAGGKVDFAKVREIVRNLNFVLKRFTEKGKRVLVFGYGNPYPDDPVKSGVVNAINLGIRWAAFGVADVVSLASVLTEPSDFANSDFHPSYAGHHKIAEKIAEIVSEDREEVT